MLTQQMMGRAMRPNSNIPKKYFIKLAAAGMGYHVTNFMTCVLALTRYEVYSTFTGKMGKLPVLIPTIKTKNKGRGKNNETTKLDFYNDFLNIHLDIDLWENFNTKANETFVDFTAIELDDFLSSMLGMKRPNNYWQDLGKEGCHQEALKYKNHTDFSNGSGGCAQASREMGWYDEITFHMRPKKRPRGWYKIKELNREVALQHPTRSLWANGKNGAQVGYEWARQQRNEDGTTWVEEFFPEPLKTGIKVGFKYSEETKAKMRKPKNKTNNFTLKIK
jgi:hypothetical protein